MQTNANLTTLSYSSNCSIQSEEIGNKIKSTMKKQEDLKKSKVRIRLNIDVRKEKGDSFLNAIKVKG